MAGDNNFPEQITATMHRQPVDELILAEEGSDASGKENVGKEPEGVSEKILAACREKNTITIAELAEQISITRRSVERNLQTLQKNGLLRRVGGRKIGYWEVLA